jgi:hypothetical protein
LFGWFNVIAPMYFYAWVTLLLGLAFLGGIGGLRHYRHFEWQLIGMLGIYTLIFLVSWWKFLELVVAGQGRLWFPLLGIIACLVAWGLANIPSCLLQGGLLGGMAVETRAFPITLIAPAYKPTPSLAHWSPPQDAVAFDFREPWAEKACSRLWLTPNSVDIQSNQVTLTFWWESRCIMSGYWSEFIHLADLNQETCVAGNTQYILAQYDTMPSGGDLPVPAFQPNTIIEERLVVPYEAVGENLAIEIGLYDAAGTFIRAIVTPPTEPTHFASLGKCGADVISLPLEVARHGIATKALPFE